MDLTMKNLQYQDGNKNKNIGHISNRVFEKKINERRHLMHVLGDTPGIQSSINECLNDFDTIRITTDKGNIFETSKENWLKNRFSKNFGHGLQYFMSRDHWTIK
jgi:hypothetical protein